MGAWDVLRAASSRRRISLPVSTPGDTTWTMRVKDEQGAVRNVVFAG